MSCGRNLPPSPVFKFPSTVLIHCNPGTSLMLASCDHGALMGTTCQRDKAENYALLSSAFKVKRVRASECQFVGYRLQGHCRMIFATTSLTIRAHWSVWRGCGAETFRSEER